MLSDRFNETVSKSGLPGSHNSVYHSIPIYIDRVFDADCGEEETEKVIKCWRENRYCNDKFLQIAQSLNRLHKTDKTSECIICFVCPSAKSNLKDSHGDCDLDEERNTDSNCRFSKT